MDKKMEMQQKIQLERMDGGSISNDLTSKNSQNVTYWANPMPLGTQWTLCDEVGILKGNILMDRKTLFEGVLDDDEGIILPKNVVSGHIIKNVDEHGNKRYDFQFENKRGYKVTIEGLSEKFNKEYWNYAKLISGVLRYRMPIEQVIKLVGSLQLDSENINTWKNGVERALKKYIQDGTEAKGKKCPNCGNETLVYQEGCLICKTCGASRCG